MAKKKATKKAADTFEEAPEGGTEVFTEADFEDAKADKYVFQLPEHYAGRRLHSDRFVCDDDARVEFRGTRSDVAPLGRILTRYYGAKLVK